MTTAHSFDELINKAAEPVSQFWPMKGFVSHNPLQGLEHLPFDEAFNEAKALFGAEGYLPAEKYRRFYQSGRISERSVDSALKRFREPHQATSSLSLSGTTLTAQQIDKIHLLNGLQPLEPALLDWMLSNGGALDKAYQDANYTGDLKALWVQVLASLKLTDDAAYSSVDSEPETNEAESVENAVFDLPFRTTLSDCLDRYLDAGIVDNIDKQIIKWTSSFIDEGMADWTMPNRKNGFFQSWKNLAKHDASAALLGIKHFSQKVSDLPDDPAEAIQTCLNKLKIPQARWSDYITRVLAQLPGWTGLIRWRGLNPDDPTQQIAPIDIVQYLAVRMFYEQEFVSLAVAKKANKKAKVEGNLPSISAYLQTLEQVTQSPISSLKIAQSKDAWRLFNLCQLLNIQPIALAEFGEQDLTTLISWLDDFPEEKHLPLWLEAYEDTYRQTLLKKIESNRDSIVQKKTTQITERPLAQAAFCIDVRSEPFRRNVENVSNIETFGYAGFFGIPISHRSYDAEESLALCPVLLAPSNAVYELPREGQKEALSNYASGSRWKLMGEKLFHDMKHSPIASFFLVDLIGLFFSAGLLGKTLFRRSYNAIMSGIKRFFLYPFQTEIRVGEEHGHKPHVCGVPVDLTRGFTIEQQANFVEGSLRVIGLTENFGRFIVLCGHGSTTDNNPYSAALDCGACGGRHGDPNARTFAAMGNNPEVRAEILARGLAIPEDTWFLAAKHDTTADRVAFYDEVDIPASHKADFELLQDKFLKGGQHQALERCQKIPGTPKNMTPEQAFEHVQSRSIDWANTRPEWGLSGNAAFIVGRRVITKGTDLEGRCFMHSYNAMSDPEGAFLEKIMTAPMVVTEWINMQYYTSATDPWKYGSGSKVIHNVVGGIGVMYGSQSDLATGLPLQTVNDGDEHYHEPVRLLVVIEANKNTISSIINKHELLQQFFHNGWLNLVSVCPETGDFHRYTTDALWEAMTL